MSTAVSALADPGDLQKEMLRSIGRIQGRAMFEDDPRAVFDFLLSEILRIARSEYGFIGEVLHRDGRPYLKTHALTNIAWDEATTAFYEKNVPDGLEFSNLDTLFGAVITSERAIIANDPASDPRSGGLPPGHPEMTAFLGLPLIDGRRMVGMVGIANRPGGYDDDVVEFLEPLIATCTACIRTLSVRAERQAAEMELRRSERRRNQLELAHVSRVAVAGELAASLAHELNQPLSAILTNARTAQRTLEKGDAGLLDEILGDIVSDSRRAGSIIHKLREFLRKGKVEVKAVDLNRTVTEVAEFLSGADSLESECIRLELQSGLPPVEADRTQIEQVIVNLIRNALEAMADLDRSEREVVVSTTTLDMGAVACSVVNQGSEITDPESLFDPFYTTKAEGMGMGLPICRSIIESHGGRIECESSDGKTTFQFVLPLAAEVKR